MPESLTASAPLIQLSHPGVLYLAPRLCAGSVNSPERVRDSQPGPCAWRTSCFNIGEGIQLAGTFSTQGTMRRVSITGFGSGERQLMVYVLSAAGQPLMPTRRYGKVRHLLREGRAVVVRRCPSTIRLMYDTPERTQPVSLGIDAGSIHIGLSACEKKHELLSAEAELRTDISNNITQRRTLRHSRRNRKTRYRKPRFQNRVHAKNKGWLAPSVQAKCDAHVDTVKKAIDILPVSEITIEMAPFDTQMLKAEMAGQPLPSGENYQHGESEGYDNIKAYVKWRDGYECRICGAEHVHLQVHHRDQRHDGGSNMPANLITVCPDCHKAYHEGRLHGKNAELMEPGPEVKPMRDAVFMGIMRWAVWNRLKQFGLPLHMTFGYITAKQREKYGLEKSHRNDARCIAGYGGAEPDPEWYYVKKVRCHNRQIHKLTIQPGGERKRNQCAYEVKGFRLFDEVRFAGQECFIFGRRTTGYFDLRKADGTKVYPCASYKKLELIHKASYVLVERRSA